MCNCNNTPLCSNNDCSCPVKDLSTDCVLYTGEDLACSGIKSQTILTDLIQQLDNFICTIQAQPTFNIVNVGTGAGVYKGVVGSNRQLRSIKSPDGSVGVAVSPNGNEIHLTANSADLIDKISLSFDWKDNLNIAERTPEDLPKGVTDTEYLRKGYIGYHKPILYSGEVDHPLYQRLDLEEYEPILIEASVQNLGVKISNFDSIKDLFPVLVISKYTNTEKRKTASPQPIPGSTSGETFPDELYRKGSFKFSADNDPIRLTRVPLQAHYQVIDFGQEHYFKTCANLQETGIRTAERGSSGYTIPLVMTRGCGKRYSTVTELNSRSQTKLVKSNTFVYLQFHIEIEVNGQKIISKSLGRLKMILSVPIYSLETIESEPEEPWGSNVIPYDYLDNIDSQRAKSTIRYKHS